MSETAQQKTMRDVCPAGGDISIAIAFADDPMKIHEVANAFPMLPAKELAEITADIEQNGITVPILLNKAGDTIIDGRNRWMIALDLGLRKSQVPVELFTGTDEEIPSVIISRNLFRRHLTDEERGALILKLLAPQWQKEAAERMHKGRPKDGGEEPRPETALGSSGQEARVKSGQGGRVIDKLAAAGQLSEHKAKQLAKAYKAGGDELLDEIISGKKDLATEAGSVPTKNRHPAKTLTFDKQVRRRWDRFIDYWEPTDRDQAKALILGWLDKDEKEGGAA
jgi:ParB-like chromosome segregation protein Spo0J